MDTSIDWDDYFENHECYSKTHLQNAGKVDDELLKLRCFLDFCFIDLDSKVKKSNCPEFNKWIDKKKEKYSCHSNNHDNKNFWNNDIENIFTDSFCENNNDPSCCIRDTGYVCLELSLMKGANDMSREDSLVLSTKSSVASSSGGSFALSSEGSVSLSSEGSVSLSYEGSVSQSSVSSTVVSRQIENSEVSNLPRYYSVTYIVGRIKLVYSICFLIIAAVILMFFLLYNVTIKLFKNQEHQ